MPISFSIHVPTGSYPSRILLQKSATNAGMSVTCSA